MRLESVALTALRDFRFQPVRPLRHLSAEKRRKDRLENLAMEVEMLSRLVTTMDGLKSRDLSRIPQEEGAQRPDHPQELRHACWFNPWAMVKKMIRMDLYKASLSAATD